MVEPFAITEPSLSLANTTRFPHEVVEIEHVELVASRALLKLVGLLQQLLHLLWRDPLLSIRTSDR